VFKQVNNLKRIFVTHCIPLHLKWALSESG
jgi:hypothetical protein